MRSGCLHLALSCALPLLAAACGGSGSPAAPTTDGPNAIVFADSGGALGSLQPAIRTLLEQTLTTTRRALPVSGVTITVTPDAAGAISGWGVGGFTPNASTVQVSIDPAFPNLAGLLPDRLPPLAAHELHHAVRWRGPGYGRTLLEALVSEGLADHFAIELLASPPPPWVEALPMDQTSRYLALARPEFDSAAYNHGRWFFGEDPGLPRWTGYTLGYRLVETYQARHAGATAAQLVNTPANEFRPD